MMCACTCINKKAKLETCGKKGAITPQFCDTSHHKQTAVLELFMSAERDMGTLYLNPKVALKNVRVYQ